jgi:hypothetical protein
MIFRTFINHKKKEILIKSAISGSGGCSGSELRVYTYNEMFAIPRIPDNYTVKVEEHTE